MNEPVGSGSDKDDPDEGIVLPSWIDAAISRTKEEADADQERLDAMPAPLPEDAVEPMSDDAEIIDDVAPPSAGLPSAEPFPSFLDRRSSMEYESERMAEPEVVQEVEQGVEQDVEPVESYEQVPEETVHRPLPRELFSPGTVDEFEAQRAALVSQALAHESERNEPIPLPVAPPRKRAPSGPWVMAAIFFGAAALVLAILIWLRPLPK